MKRRRLDEEEPVNVARKDSENPAETISEPKKGEQQKPNVTHIITTSDGATVVTVTAEDKSINAFNVEPEGVLSLQSQR